MNREFPVRLIKRMRTVQRVEDWDRLKDGDIGFVFFFCPRMKSSGFWVNEEETGLETKYVPGISGFSAQRIARVAAFREEFGRLAGQRFSITAIFASADSALLFPRAVPPPATPNEKDVGFPVWENLTAFNKFRDVWESFRNQKPWEKGAPYHIRDAEARRLRALLGSVPRPLADDFIDRVFAGFAFDGVMLRTGGLGVANPVILGVESPGVPTLQNAGLEPMDRIPVIQLR